MTLKEEIIQQFFSKSMTFEEVTGYMREAIIGEYQGRNDQFGFDWRFENIKMPNTTVCNSCDPIITFHLPKSNDYNNNDIRRWFEANGFEMTEINYNKGYRIIL